MTPQMMQILHRISLLHAPNPETVFEQIATATLEVYPTAMVMINLVEGDCLRFRTVVNTHPAFENISQLAMNSTLCQFALASRSPLVIQNAAEHADFCHHAVVELQLRRYLGVPISDTTGQAFGTLCFLDDQIEDDLAEQDVQFLSLLAMRVSSELERERLLTAQQRERDAQRALQAVQARERHQYETDASRFKAFIECTADAVIGFDMQGRMTDWNNGAAQIFGYTAEEAIGHSYTLLGTAEVYDFQHQVFAETLRGDTHQWYDTRRRHKNGTVIDVSITTSPLILQGEIRGLVAIVRDITDKVRAAEALHERNLMLDRLAQEQSVIAQQLAELNARLKTQAEEKRNFVNMVIHDLRHPLTTMRTALHLLRIEPDQVERLAHLEMLEMRTRALATLLDELILYDQIEAGKSQLALIMQSPETVLRACIAEVTGLTGADAVPIYCEIDPGLGKVALDTGKLRHILLNLLTNALKFTSQGHITVRAAGRDARRWCLEVQDTGIGMSSQEQLHAFEEYFSGGKGPEGGMGLGLAIMRRLCTALNADVELHSALGKGTHFILSFPRTFEQALEQALEKSEAEKPAPARPENGEAFQAGHWKV